MRAFFRIAIIAAGLELSLVSLYAQLPNCPVRQTPGTLVQNPLSLQSKNGGLTVDLALRNGVDQYGFMHYCYDYPANDTSGKFIEAPTLRLYPGDTLTLNLANRTTPNPGAPAGMDMQTQTGSGDCQGGMITSTTTNLHFHGLNVPPVCHQDDVINTVIQSGDAPFQYKIQIPANEPPGLYWYHPHAHGQTTTQVEGGASGAIIVEGIENVRPEVKGLKERVLILRQQFYNQNSWLPGPFQLTLNFQTALPEVFPLPIIAMEPNKKEFWRFLNSGTQAFVRIQVRFSNAPQSVELISMDGVPLTKPLFVTGILVPPAGRAEFIVPGLPPGEQGQFVTVGVYTGQTGNPNASTQIADIITEDSPTGSTASSPAAPRAGSSGASGVATAASQRFAGLQTAVPTAKRNLYFSELQVSPNLIKFFITVDGQEPRSFTANEPPAIVTQVGAVEDWTIENRAREIHAFHIHQIHFLVTAVDGKPVPQPMLRDTISIPAWDGRGPYHSVTMRMDFRDPEIAGMFVYHCHILDHEDAGMMAKILVKPAGSESQAALPKSPHIAAARTGPQQTFGK
jgi:FtsP/CotA-like multicopper oxidase with cupredoxin domain